MAETWDIASEKRNGKDEIIIEENEQCDIVNNPQQANCEVGEDSSKGGTTNVGESQQRLMLDKEAVLSAKEIGHDDENALKRTEQRTIAITDECLQMKIGLFEH